MYKLNTENWNVVRVVYLGGGLIVLVSSSLSLVVDVRWSYFTVFVGLMLINFALTGYCPLAIILAKLGIPKN
ncbi:MAG: DUF2892 domain-containing protein [Candidatus Moranbacteria bacterium]|jgi:hypothetical protein|nr:DUF2892 domain-containing protein [Candidatus Moranbacteria bacterium]